MRMFSVTCLSCGVHLKKGDGRLVCRTELHREPCLQQTVNRCLHCDKPLFFPTEGQRCYDCALRAKAGKVFLSRSRAIFLYRGILRDLYQMLKYGGKKGAGEDIVRRARDCEGEWRVGANEFDVVTVVSSHWFHSWKRGFSPVVWFWERFYPSIEKNVLCRRFPRRVQKNLRREERMNMIQGQFSVRCPQRVQGKRVLVLDDVYTTGSTLEEIARVLKTCGASAVESLVIFRD